MRPPRTVGTQLAGWPAGADGWTLTGKDHVANGPIPSVIEAAPELPVDLWAHNLG